MKYILQVILLFYISMPSALGQIIEIPLTENKVLQQYIARHGHPELRSIEKNGLNNTLPFFDDFTYAGPYPNPEYWENNLVYVNSGMAKTPPSYGVATFDGLNAIGKPYSGGYGGSDTLTSRAFDLSSYTPADNIYLSYFIQAKGLGEKPEAIDSLVVEFKNNSGSWVRIAQYGGLSGVAADFIPDFAQFFHPVTSNAYLHSTFQFRFRNYSARTGFIDIWNLDYIEMDANRSANATGFNDITQVSLPKDILNTYASMPFDQFIADIPGELELSVVMEITNHFSTGKEVNPRQVKATERLSGANILPATNMGQANFTSGQTLLIQDQLSFNDFNFSALPSDMDKAEVITEYFLQTTSQGSTAIKNDTCRIITYFDDYFAYDDGSAESNIIAQGQGVQVALKFHANVADTIQAVQFHFQHVQGNVENQEFNIYVWKDDLNSAPVFDLIFENPSYVDTINGFTQYNFDEPVFLESGDDFFVGWQQFTQTSNSIPIGFDKNNPDASQFAYYNLGSSWVPFTGNNLQGALMVRPIMGFDLFVSNQEVVAAEHHLDIFPNPVADHLNIQLIKDNYDDYAYQIFDALGRLTGIGMLSEQIEVSNLSNGLHFMQITHLPSNSVMHHKLVKISF